MEKLVYRSRLSLIKHGSDPKKDSSQNLKEENGSKTDMIKKNLNFSLPILEILDNKFDTF